MQRLVAELPRPAVAQLQRLLTRPAEEDDEERHGQAGDHAADEHAGRQHLRREIVARSLAAHLARHQRRRDETQPDHRARGGVATAQNRAPVGVDMRPSTTGLLTRMSTTAL